MSFADLLNTLLIRSVGHSGSEMTFCFDDLANHVHFFPRLSWNGLLTVWPLY